MGLVAQFYRGISEFQSTRPGWDATIHKSAIVPKTWFQSSHSEWDVRPLSFAACIWAC